MKYKIGFYVVLMCLVISCKKDDPPIYSPEPNIEFRDFQFVDVPNSSLADTLIVSFYFIDHDSDLGLPGVPEPPYQLRTYFSQTDGHAIPETEFDKGNVKLDELLNFKFKRTHLPDTLPDYTAPFSCTNWHVLMDADNLVVDTLYYQTNLNYYNLYMDLYIVENNGSSTYFDFVTQFPENCLQHSLDDRFPTLPFLNQSFLRWNLKMLSDKDGIFTYKIPSAAWTGIFANQNIKAKIAIRDRALHLSNVVESSPIHFP